MRFFRVYIEITNACGLKCDFCPPKSSQIRALDLRLFEKIIGELKGKTKEIAFHIMGDPLLNKNLRFYLDLAYEYSHKVSLTTSGFYVGSHEKSVLTHKAISQLNISLNSFNKNSRKITLDEYLTPIFSLIDYKLEHNQEKFINLRLWNVTPHNKEAEFNEMIFRELETRYGIKISGNWGKKESFRIAKRVRAHFDELFVWPSLGNDIFPNSPCYGLNRQLGVLSNGTVVPCCLDYEAKVDLGDAAYQNLYDIVNGAKKIAQGLKNGVPTEELCKRCSYRLRFL